MAKSALNSIYVNTKEAVHTMESSHFSQLMRAVLEKGKAFRFQAAGFSMEPFIKNEDVITIIPLKIDKIRKGDVLTFTHPIYKSLMVHRVILCQNENFLMKADNTCLPDGWITAKDVIGLIKSIERDGILIRFGLGPEKMLISTLSRLNLIRPKTHKFFYAIAENKPKDNS